ncbi:MAG: hypothetical protein ACOX7A_03765 [Lawsonibacter sp.]
MIDILHRFIVSSRKRNVHLQSDGVAVTGISHGVPQIGRRVDIDRFARRKSRGGQQGEQHGPAEQQAQ